MLLFGKLTFFKLLIFGNNNKMKWWKFIFSGQSKKTVFCLFSIEKSIFKAYFKKIKLIKSPLPGGQQVLKGSEPPVNSWDDSNKKRILFGWPPGVGLYTLTPSICVKINPTNLIFCMNAFLRNSQGILWSRMWILNIYFESSRGQPVCICLSHLSNWVWSISPLL